MKSLKTLPSNGIRPSTSATPTVGKSAAEDPQNTLGNSAIQSQMLSGGSGVSGAGDIASSIHEGNAAVGMGQSSGNSGEGPSFLDTGIRQTKTQTDTGGSSIRGAGGSVDVKQRVVTGKWGDTFEGDRWNARAGCGFNDTGNFTGGGKGNTSSGDVDENGQWTGSQADADEEAYSQMVGEDMYALTEGMSDTEREVVLTSIAETMMTGEDAGKPREDDSSGGWAPAPGQDPGREAQRGVRKPGNAGGGYDGRGDRDSASKGTGRQTDRAIGSQFERAGRVQKERNNSPISFETAMKGNLVINPGRTTNR